MAIDHIPATRRHRWCVDYSHVNTQRCNTSKCSDAKCSVLHADGKSAIRSTALAALDKTLGGVITEFVNLNEFAGKVVSSCGSAASSTATAHHFLHAPLPPFPSAQTS